MPDIRLHSGLSLLEAHQVAIAAGMFLIEVGGEVKISPIVPPGGRKIPLRIKITAPDRGRIELGERVAA